MNNNQPTTLTGSHPAAAAGGQPTGTAGPGHSNRGNNAQFGQTDYTYGASATQKAGGFKKKKSDGRNEKLFASLSMSPEEKLLTRNYGPNYDSYLINLTGGTSMGLRTNPASRNAQGLGAHYASGKLSKTAGN